MNADVSFSNLPSCRALDIQAKYLLGVHRLLSVGAKSLPLNPLFVKSYPIPQLSGVVPEPQRRWYVATLSESPDSPGDRQLTLITGLDEKAIRRGKVEIANELSDLPTDRQRQEGGGRLAAEKKTQG
jgi:hypothetical protein